MPSSSANPANICCPPKYTYIGKGLCCPSSIPNCDIKQTVSSIPCDHTRCCPEGYAYISSDGTFFNPLTGAYVTIGNMPMDPFINNCCKVVNLGARNPWAILPDPAPDPIDCPCCPDGYTYDSINGDCIGSTPRDIVPTIPCIGCVCPDPPPPPKCDVCGNQLSDHVSLTFITNSKNCTDCNPPDGSLSTNTAFNSFLAINLINPLTNFFLK